MNLQADGRKRLHLGIRCDAFFFLVSIELASHQMLWVQRWNGAEYFDLFIADRVAMQPSGRLHSQKGHNLKHVVLDYIADCPGGVVKFTSPLDAELFSHCDLHTLDVIPIPDRLQKTIGKAKEQKIEDCLFTEVVIDAKDSRFRKHRMKCGVQLPCGSQ